MTRRGGPRWHSAAGVELLRRALGTLELAERPVVVVVAEQTGEDLASRTESALTVCKRAYNLLL